MKAWLLGVLAAASMVLTMPAFAQAAEECDVPEANDTSPISPEARTFSEAYMSEVIFGQSVEPAFIANFRASIAATQADRDILAANPGLQPALEEAALQALHSCFPAHIGAMQEEVARIADYNATAPQINQIAAFYRSPTGQAIQTLSIQEGLRQEGSRSTREIPTEQQMQSRMESGGNSIVMRLTAAQRRAFIQFLNTRAGSAFMAMGSELRELIPSRTIRLMEALRPRIQLAVAQRMGEYFSMHPQAQPPVPTSSPDVGTQP